MKLRDNLLIAGLFCAIGGARLLWDEPGDLLACSVFWAGLILVQIGFWVVTRNPWFIVQCTGIISNAIATVANNGAMPVAGEGPFTGVHIPLTADASFPWLTDVLWFGASIGDVFITIAMFGILSGTFRAPKKAWQP